jgi:GTP-binding protein
MDNFSKLKNIAVVAHVDHGKTTMVDELLKQSGTYTAREEIVERVMDSGDIEKERGITIKAKNCAIFWNDCKINLLDTPGHADFGGEVERSLMMVDGVLLLVDAAEGCLPQTRFVLSKAMERGIKIGVIINKVDRPDQRIEEVKGEIEDLFLELATFLDIGDFDLDIPFLYSSAKNGWATNNPDEETDNMKVVLDFMASDYFPEPVVEKDGDLQILLTNLSHDSYLGSLIIGRIQRGKIEKHTQYTAIGKEKAKNFKVASVQVYDKLGMKEVANADAGEIVILAGLEGAQIGDSIVNLNGTDALPRIEVEPPTVGVFVSVSTSPLSGKEGDYLTSRKLEEFLTDSCRTNVSLKYVATDDPKVYQLKGRGELQLAIVFEELRREGFEFMLSRPAVLLATDEDGNKTEPYEKLVMDIPEESTGAITEKLSKRKGIMEGMVPIGESRTRVEFVIPSRGLIGYRSRFLTDTRGEGIMSSEYLGYREYAGDMLARQNGAIIADRAGKMTPYALFNLISLGEQFVLPGEQCYEGMVIGEYTKVNDTNVNAVREKHLSSMRTAGKDVNIVLPPIQPRTLEWALDWIDNDEWVEVTPQSIRIRKKTLECNKRSVVREKKDKK